MVSELHARKAALEAKLAEKNRELKLLCIQEAELTGILPPEIPLEPGESPPVFRRRIGTAYSFPESLISNNKPKFKEDESLSTLELECRIQTNIAEAALVLANDVAATKAVRRKHRNLYQQSQRRLSEIQSQLNDLRQSRTNLLPKQRKKPRPPLENETSVDEGFLHDGGVSLSPPPVAAAQWEAQMRVAQHRSNRHQQLHRTSAGYAHHYNTLASCAHPEIERLDQGVSTPGYWLRYEANETENVWFATAPRQMQRTSQPVRHCPPDPRLSGSLDRRKPPPQGLPTPPPPPPPAQTLLPGQTYPEHGLALVRTQSLGSVKHREWHETSLDATPVPQQQQQPASLSRSSSNVSSERRLAQLHSPSGSNVSSERRTIPLGSPSGSNVSSERRMGAVEHPERRMRTLEHSERRMGPIDHSDRRMGHLDPSDRRMGTLDHSERRMMPLDPLDRRMGTLDHLERRMMPLDPSDRRTMPLDPSDRHVVPLDPIDRRMVPLDPIDRRMVPLDPTDRRVGHLDPSERHTTPLASPSGSSVSSERRQLPLETRNSNSTPSEHPEGLLDSPNSRQYGGTVPLESPRNHTVVQAGKWQPYREVTKPFEMSDFYKYSTKFRRGDAPPLPQQPVPPPRGVEGVATGPVPQQKGVYQPLKPQACSPMDPGTKSPTEGEEGAEGFNAELAWYQDKSVTRSATLV